jgi:uncharacterized protein (DUF924 family)
MNYRGEPKVILPTCQTKFWNAGLIRRTGAIGSTLLDELVRQRLAPLYADAIEGRLDHWKDHPDGALALCILFDQPRNIFRGSARAFATDTEARSVARHILVFGFDRSYPTDDHRVLCYLPFEHSEDIEDQRLALQLVLRISEVLSMNQYFRDERFASKKAKLDGTPEQQCGDNIYSLIPAIVVAIFLLPPSAVVQCSGAAQ